jgi:hypothetical protein
VNNLLAVFFLPHITFHHCICYILWHIDPLLGNDRETNNEITAVARQPPVCNIGSTVGSSVFCVEFSVAT